MQLLETELTANGYRLNQVKRQGQVALYSQHGKHGKIVSYEVILIKSKPASEIFGKQYPEREVYPSNEDWGAMGWTYPDLASAEKTFESALEETKKGQTT